MAARLALLCHGATAATRAAAFPTGEPLDASAMPTIDALSQRLPACRHWLTSPAPAAVQTAERLRADGATVDPALRDIDPGRWAGQRLDAVQEAEPEALGAWLSDPEASPHGGDSLASLFARVGSWMAARERVDGATLAVTHAAVIRAAVALALDAGPRSFWRIDVAPLSLARLSGRGGRWTLVSLGPVLP